MTTRRTLLQGLAALPVAAVPAIVPDRVVADAPDPVFAAIEKHRVAWADFGDACGRSGKFSEPPKHLEEATEAASDAAQEAAYELHETVPVSLAGLAAYVAYWNEHCLQDEFMMEDTAWEAVPTIAEACRNLLPTVEEGAA